MLRAEPQLVADSGPVSASDLSDEFRPAIRAIRHVRTGRVLHDGTMELGTEDGDIEVTVTVPGETAVGLKLRLETGDS